MKIVIVATETAARTAEMRMRRIVRAARDNGVELRFPWLPDDDSGAEVQRIGGGAFVPDAQARPRMLLTIIAHPTNGTFAVLLPKKFYPLLQWAGSAQGQAAIVPNYLTLTQYNSTKTAIQGRVDLTLEWGLGNLDPD